MKTWSGISMAVAERETAFARYGQTHADFEALADAMSDKTVAAWIREMASPEIIRRTLQHVRTPGRSMRPSALCNGSIGTATTSAGCWRAMRQ
jgi:hypothetical protein